MRPVMAAVRDSSRAPDHGVAERAETTFQIGCELTGEFGREPDRCDVEEGMAIDLA